MTQLIVSLDVNDLSKAIQLIDVLSPKIDIFKVGIIPYTLFGGLLLHELKIRQKKVFLDLKFHDIPNTVKNAVRAAALKGVFMMTLHTLGGYRMLASAVAGINEADVTQKPLLFGVTILTSMNDDDIDGVGIRGPMEKRVLELAYIAKNAGLDGVIASALEIKAIKEKIGKDFLAVTPGVRPAWLEKNQKEDQTRIMTPHDASLAGANYIVIGRPIIQADDPLMVANKVIDEISE